MTKVAVSKLDYVSEIEQNNTAFLEDFNPHVDLDLE
jgi:hypothetical protein